MKNYSLILTAFISLMIFSCEKESTNNSNTNSTERIVLNDSQILYHYSAESSIDLAGKENLWEENFYEYDDQHRIIKRTLYYYDPNGVLYDTTYYKYEYQGAKVIMYTYNGNNINYGKNVYVLNSNKLKTIDSSYSKNLFFTNPKFEFNIDKMYDYENNKIVLEYAGYNKLNALKAYWKDGNAIRWESYSNGVLNQKSSTRTFNNRINKNYQGNFFENGMRNRNWVQLEAAEYPKATFHTYKTEVDGFVTEDLTTRADSTGKITGYYKVIYK